MLQKITAKTINDAKARVKPYEIRGQIGLILRVQPTGKKTSYCEYARGKRLRVAMLL